jgi:hypothetical protein
MFYIRISWHGSVLLASEVTFRLVYFTDVGIFGLAWLGSSLDGVFRELVDTQVSDQRTVRVDANIHN